MKSIVVLFLVGFACANAQGVDFLIDNIVDPAITQIIDNTSSFLTNQLISILFGWLIGKRDLGVSQIQQVVSQVQGLLDQYKDKIEQLVGNYSQQLQSLFNIFNLLGPKRSNTRIQFVNLINTFETQIKEEALNLLNNLYQQFQQILGQNFLALFGSKGRTVFGNVTSVINNLSSSITQLLENYGESLLQTALNISELSAPLMSLLQSQLTGTAGNVFQQIQQIINQLQQN